MNHNTAVRTLQILNHILSIVGVTCLFMGVPLHYALIALISYWATGVLGINIGLHRLLSHRSFETHPLIEKILSVIGVLTTVGSPLAWVTLHRQHHKNTETPADPHSPYQIGSARAWFGVWNIKHLDLKLIKDLRKDPFQKQLHKRYFSIIFAYCLILLLIDPLLVIYMYAIPAVLCLHSSSSIIVIAHKHGYKTHNLGADEARNSWIANLITLGEGWHNNHHANPRAWNNQEKWWEIDPTAMIVKLIKK